MKKFNLQFFAEGGEQSMSASQQLESLLNDMDAGTDNVDDTVQQPTEQEGNGSTKDGIQQDTSPQVPTDNQSTKQTQTQSQKMNHAFGQLRQQNAQYKSLLTKLAQATGIDFKDENELIEKLNNNALEQMSKKDNVPVELLQRMDALERQNAQYTAQQRQSAVLVGFQKIADTYNLDDVKLQEFAKRLDEAGKNPFIQDIDLEETYKTMYFDEIVNQKVEEAVKAALSTTSVADAHSTTPNNKQGKGSTDNGQKISTVQQLSDMLNNVNL